MRDCFAEIGHQDAVHEEARAVIDDDRKLAEPAGKGCDGGDGFVRRSLPRTTSTSGIFSTGLKKCMPTTLSGRFDAVASSVMERDEVFEAKMRLFSGCGFEIPEHGFFDVHVLDDSFDGDVRPCRSRYSPLCR